MFEIIFTYERYTTAAPFYRDTKQGTEYKNLTHDLGKESGLLKNQTSFVSEDQLTMITTYEFENKQTCLQYLKLVHERFPDLTPRRTEYLVENSHRLSRTATDAVFPNGIPGEFVSSNVSPNPT